MTDQESLTPGDVVRHRLHGKKEVIVGTTHNRFYALIL